MKKKIGVLGAKGFPGFGGASGASENIFVRLVNDYDITVYAIDTHAKESNYRGITQIIFKSYRNKKVTTFLYYIKSVLHALFLSKYDFIHINHISSGFFILILRVKYKVLCNVRGLNYSKDDKWNWFYKVLLRTSDYFGTKYSNEIITVQKGSINHLNRFKKNNVYFIPNGVDDLSMFLKENKKYDIVFAAARIIFLKGLHDLLQALQKINYKGTILIIGDLDQVKDYKKTILKLSEGLNLNFCGLVKSKCDLFNLIGESKLFVFPSYTEGMSNMLLEVASIGTPILASDISQNKEVFDESEVTFYKVGNVENLIQKLIEISKNEDKHKNKTFIARKKIIKNHNWNKIANDYSRIYSKLK